MLQLHHKYMQNYYKKNPLHHKMKNESCDLVSIQHSSYKKIINIIKKEFIPQVKTCNLITLSILFQLIWGKPCILPSMD